MSKFKPEDFAGLVSSPPQGMARIENHMISDKLAELDAKSARLDEALKSFDDLDEGVRDNG